MTNTVEQVTPAATVPPVIVSAGLPPLVPEEHEVNVAEYVGLIWARRWTVLAITVLAVAVAGVWAFTRPRLYRAEAEISVSDRQPQIIKNQISMGPNYWELERYSAEQEKVLGTRRLAQRVVDRLGLASYPGFAGGDPANQLRAMLRINREETSNIILLSLTSTDPAAAAEWLNVLIEEYVAANIEDNLGRTRKVYEVIQSRLDPLRDQLQVSEQELMQFREREDALLFADQDKNVISEQVNTLTSEYAAAKAERIRLETMINALGQIGTGQVSETSFPDALKDTTVQALRQQRSQAQLELADKLRTLKEGHPVIKELRSRVAELEAREREQAGVIRTSLQTDFNMVSQRERSLFANIQQLKDQSIELSKQTMQYDRLKREYDQNKAFLEEMLARSKEVDISSTASVNNVRVIEPALAPARPFSPNIPRSLGVGLALGLLLGVGAVLALDYLDQTLRTPLDVERHLGLEVLSVLPVHTDSRSRVQLEPLQSLRTALMLASRGQGCQVLMVTSAVPGEGKTTAVFELGKVLAAGGDRVLLLDADLRRPRLHRLSGFGNSTGLTSVVLGERRLEEVAHGLDGISGLSLVTSGPLPPNPPELFGKASFLELLDKARKEYDWVVIDTPPVASVTDSVICAGLADMALLVVQYAGPRRQVVISAIRQLARSGVRMAGVLFNKVDMERDHYYYYSHYSYYRYGYHAVGEGSTAPVASQGSVGA